jgi:hypothetical protein
MVPFKIKYYEEEFGEGTFPWYRALSDSEKDAFFELVARAMHWPGSADDPRLYRLIERVFEHAGQLIDEDDEDIDGAMAEAMKAAGIPDDSKVIAAQLHSDDVDEFVAADLTRIIHDVWYPGSDVLLVVDPESMGMVLIDDGGYLSVHRPDSFGQADDSRGGVV